MYKISYSFIYKNNSREQLIWFQSFILLQRFIEIKLSLRTSFRWGGRKKSWQEDFEWLIASSGMSDLFKNLVFLPTNYMKIRLK